MSWWKQRSYLSSDDATPGGAVNRSPSPPRKSRGKKSADDDYPSYAAADTNRDGGYNGGGGYGGGYSNGYGGSGAPYGNDSRGIMVYGNGGGGGYNNNNPPYGNVSDGYNAPGSWGAQDPAARTPMYISTREVHVYGAPQPFDGDDQRRRGGGGGGGGGFFGPALHAVGHFVDRRFGLDDRN